MADTIKPTIEQLAMPPEELEPDEAQATRGGYSASKDIGPLVRSRVSNISTAQNKEAVSDS
jgi:hypothetical protein